MFGRPRADITLCEDLVAILREVPDVSDLTAANSFANVTAEAGDEVAELLERARTLEHSDPAGARSLIQQARSVAYAAGNRSGEAEALYRLASLCYYAGRPDEAFAVAVEARDLALEYGHNLVVAWTLNLIGIVHLGAGNYSEALQCCLESVDRYRMTGHRVDEGNHLNTIATVYNALGDTDRAIVTLESALAANRQLDRPDFDAITMANMATLRTEREEYLLAVSLGEQALELARDHAPSFIPQILTALGKAYVGIGDVEHAVVLLRDALEALESQSEDEAASLDGGMPTNAADRAAALWMLGRALAACGDYKTAVMHLNQGLDLATDVGARHAQLDLHTTLAEVHKTAGDFEAAVDHLEARFVLDKEIFNEGTDLRIRTLQIAHDSEQARQQAEIMRLRATELPNLIDDRTSALEEFQVQVLEKVAVGDGADGDGRRAENRAVGDLAARLATELRMPQVWAEQLRAACRLRHVDPELMVGSPSQAVRVAEEVVRSRRERWDGTGLPDGREGSAIPVAGRIVAVAETYCSSLPVISGSSPAEQAIAGREAFDRVAQRSGTVFDPDVVDALARLRERDALTVEPRAL